MSLPQIREQSPQVPRKIPRISYKDRVTNEEVRAKSQQAIGSHEDLLTIVKRRKLQWYGHVSRSSGLAKTILQGTVKGRRRQGRRRKRWEDYREWTGLEFVKSQRPVDNKEKWRKLVVKSSVVPKRPPWMLWDRWGEVRWGEVKWDEVGWSEVRWDEVRWYEVRWGEMKWDEVRWGEVRWGEARRGEAQRNREEVCDYSNCVILTPPFRRFCFIFFITLRFCKRNANTETR